MEMMIISTPVKSGLQNERQRKKGRMMLTLNNNILAALDLETTGLLDGYHDIIQVAVVPLDSNLDPMDISPFYMSVRPEHPEWASPKAMQINGLSLEELESAPTRWQVADCFDVWWEGLGLGRDKKLVYLTQNAPFDIPFTKHWLGTLGFDKYFHRRGRDTMFSALYLNDQAAWKNRPIPFPRVGLKGLCKTLGIPLDNHHDALADCIATAKVYKELLRYEA
jgi:DNA polymerase III epsilon subunit-like protein